MMHDEVCACQTEFCATFASLWHLQQQLQPNTVSALRKAVPALSEADVGGMMRAPMRSYDPTILQVGR